MRREVGAREGDPSSFGDGDMAGLLVQVRNKVCPAFRTGECRARTFRPAWRAARDVHEHDGQTAFAEGVGQRARSPQDVAHRVNDGQAREALLQADNDQAGVWIENGEGHERTFQETRRPASTDLPETPSAVARAL